MIAMLLSLPPMWFVLHPAIRLAFADSCTRPKHSHASCVTGGSDPTELWAAQSRQKWGRSRPFWWFFHADFCPHRFAMSHASKKLLAPQAEELAEDGAEACSSYVLHPFPLGSCMGSPTGCSTSVAKCTIT